MLKLGSNSIGRIFLGSNSIGKAYLGSDLVFQKGSQQSYPYTPLEYIETDGTAYINTGIIGTGARSARIKALAVSGGGQVLLGVNPNEDNNSTMFIMCAFSSASKCYFGYYSFYSSDAPSVSNSITNETPFEVHVSLAKDAQSLGLKQNGESAFTLYSKSQSSQVSNTAPMYLFTGCNPSGLVPVSRCKSGTRVYYCKIYSDESYETLVFDGLPCYFDGEYGLWDRVTNTFFGNVAGSGAFTGPAIN